MPWRFCSSPYRGYGAGVFTEAGNLAAFIDRHIIAPPLWNEGPTATPSGICVVLIGSLAGLWLKSNRSPDRKALGLACVGALSLAAGLVLSQWLPIIKRILWSPSYVLVACGLSLLLLALFYWVIDARGYRRWAFFFVVIGMNAITIYFGQRLINFHHITQVFFGGLLSYTGPLEVPATAIANLAVVWIFLWFLYRHKVFLRV